ncbi:MAG TPA: class I SAM-dependent methyltransferase, partial [Pseudodesulfovibrio sp.]|nr:class I SAM-dependent methyltransferase [Pseudodesulfovibrio sp.]
MSMGSDNKTLDKVYTATNHAELMDAYKDWANDYDSDTLGSFGYVAPVAAARAMERVAPGTDVRILDAGCGTGQVGQILTDKGFGDIHAL